MTTLSRITHLHFIANCLFDELRLKEGELITHAQCEELHKRMTLSLGKIYKKIKKNKTIDKTVLGIIDTELQAPVVLTLSGLFKYLKRYDYRDDPLEEDQLSEPSELTLIRICCYLLNKTDIETYKHWWLIFDETIDPHLPPLVKALLQSYYITPMSLVNYFVQFTTEDQLSIAADIILKKRDYELGEELYNACQDLSNKLIIGCFLMRINPYTPHLVRQLFQNFELEPESGKLTFAQNIIHQIVQQRRINTINFKGIDRPDESEYEGLLRSFFLRLAPSSQTHLIIRIASTHPQFTETLIQWVSQDQLGYLAFELVQVARASPVLSLLDILDWIKKQQISNVHLRNWATSLLEAQFNDWSFYQALIAQMKKNNANIELANLARHVIRHEKKWLETTEPLYRNLILEIAKAIQNGPSLRRLIFDLINENFTHLSIFKEVVQLITVNVELREIVLKLIEKGLDTSELIELILQKFSNDMEKARILREVFRNPTMFVIKWEKPMTVFQIIDSLWEGEALMAICQYYIEWRDWTEQQFEDQFFAKLLEKGAFIYAYQVLLFIVHKEKLKETDFQQKKLQTPSLLLNVTAEETTYPVLDRLLAQIAFFDPHIPTVLIRYLSSQPLTQPLSQVLTVE